MWIVIADVGGDTLDRLVRGVEQLAGVLHFQVDEMLDRRVSGQLLELAHEVKLGQACRLSQIVEIELAVYAAVHQLLDLVEIDAGAATVAVSGYEACDIGEGGFELAGRMYEYAFIAAGAAQCEQGLEVSDQPRLDADTGHRFGHTQKARVLIGHCPLVVNPV